MDAATAAEALAGVREQIHENAIAAMVAIWSVMMDAFPMVREAESAKMDVGKRCKKKATVTPIRGAGRAV